MPDAFQTMKTPLRRDEQPVMGGLGNHQRGIEAVGGRLYLTDRRLVFESHRLNVQAGATELPLSEIARVEPCWSRFLGLVPVVPNGMLVTTRDGAQHRFVLWRRVEWISAIQARIGAPDATGSRGPRRADAR